MLEGIGVSEENVGDVLEAIALDLANTDTDRDWLLSGDIWNGVLLLDSIVQVIKHNSLEVRAHKTEVMYVYVCVCGVLMR